MGFILSSADRQVWIPTVWSDESSEKEGRTRVQSSATQQPFPHRGYSISTDAEGHETALPLDTQSPLSGWDGMQAKVSMIPHNMCKTEPSHPIRTLSSGDVITLGYIHTRTHTLTQKPVVELQIGLVCCFPLIVSHVFLFPLPPGEPV